MAVIAIQQLVMGALIDTEVNKSNGRLCEQVSTPKSSRDLYLLLRTLVLLQSVLTSRATATADLIPILWDNTGSKATKCRLNRQVLRHTNALNLFC